MQVNWKLPAVLTAVVIVLLCLLFWTSKTSSDKDGRYKAEREKWILGEAHMKGEIRLRDSVISATREEREKADSLYHVSEKSRLTARNELKRRERSQRPDTIRKTLVDTVYASYDSALIAASEKSRADSLSFEKELSTLQAVRLDLDSANTSKFNVILDQSKDLESKEKKISRLEKLSSILGISSGVMAIILIIIIAF
jgi:hypothetical protein